MTTIEADAVASLGGSSGEAETARVEFLAVFDELVVELADDLSSNYELPPHALPYVVRSLKYNVPHGKLNRGLAVASCVAAFWEGAVPAKGPMTPELKKKADVLGWCVELLQAFFLVADDIMDDSKTRRGQKCFYLLEEVGLKAVNDSLMLEMMIYRTIRRHFRSEPYYMQVVELFQDTTYTTEVGQLLDLTTQGGVTVDLAKFTEATLYRIYRYKTCYYSFYLSVALGMIISGVSDQTLYEKAKAICIEIGYYFQAMDDILDCFGDPAVTGKVGTDIEENKCTWLAVEAMKTATNEDKAVILENYGSKDPEKVANVKALYTALDIQAKFKAYEEESFARIQSMIDDVLGMPTGAFTFLLNKVYKRKK